MGCEIGGDGGGLVRRHGKDVAEAAARVNYCFAGFFGVSCCDGCVGLDLRGAYSRDVGASAGEGGVECSRAAGVEGSSCALGVGAAFGAVSCYAIVSRGVDKCHPGETELHILVALTDFVRGG